MEKKQKRRVIWLWCRDVILPFFLIYILFFQVFGIEFVVGNSMEPTYKSGNILLINRLQRRDVQRGDVVIAYAKNSSGEKKLLKRVIGIPGDTLYISQEGVVIINGAELDEPYAITPTPPGSYHVYPIQIPEGYVFLMGDNRPNSADSRSEYGLIAISDIVGIVIGSRRS